MRPVGALTAAVLAGIAGLHVAWGLGSAFPLADRADLADAVAGTDEFPGRNESFAVAALLGAAAVAVVEPPVLPRRLTGLGRLGVVTVLGTRGVLGVTNRTGRAVGWTTSRRFDRLDRRVYGPLCLALAVGAWAASGTVRR